MKKIILTACTAVVLSGCSSIVSKSDYPVAINTSPSGASFVITNEKGQKVHQGVTPTTVNLKSSAGYFNGESYTVRFKKTGYKTQDFQINSSIDGWYVGNILFGGLIGWLVVDPLTGAMYNLPERVDVTLESAEVSKMQSDGIKVITLDALTQEEKDNLVRIN